jgi:dihydroneopterin aldolase
MADIIAIRDLKLEAFIGIYPWEQRIKQPLIFNLQLETDTRKAATSALLTDTIDYAALTQHITKFMSQRSFPLLEMLAEEISKLILDTYNVAKIRLQISKPGALANAKEVEIIIERNRLET